MNLPVLNWDEKFSVGFKLIDEQHKGLFELYNKVVAVKRNPSKDLDPTAEFTQILGELNNYIRVHFLTEEEVMKTYHYEEFENHKKIHDQFKDLVQEITNDQSKNELILMDVIIKQIYNWLVNHVLVQDQKFRHIFTKT